MLVIDDDNWQQHATDFDQGGEKRLRGRIPRDYAKVPYGSMPFAKPFDIPLIPRSEWQARIKDMEQSKSLLSDLMIARKVPSLDQNGTNYCWCNGVVTAMYAVRCLARLPHVDLSPASVAAPIKGYQNVGGWGTEALEYIVKHGVAPASEWPPNAISSKYDNEHSKADRGNYKILEWYDMEGRNLDQLMTALLLRIPVAIGLNFWSHEVCAIDPAWVNGGPAVRFRNSWGETYGSHGFGILAGSKCIPDDQCAPRVVSSTAA